MGGKSLGGLWRLTLLPALLLFASCSDQTLSLFFDIPPPTEEELAAAAKEKAEAEVRAAREAAIAAGAPLARAEEEVERPAIEAVTAWEQAWEMLPKDVLDEANWVEALRQGIIKPKAEIDRPGNPEAAIFKFDFFLPGPDPSTDAYFPHSVHTQWLNCESCHPKIFPIRDTQITMDDLFEGGKFCAVCHGVVAFAPDDCARCHPAMGG